MRAPASALLLLLLAAGCRTAAPTSAPAPASAAPAPTGPTAAASAQDGGTPAAQPPPLTADEETAARELVNNNCLGCHTGSMLEQQRLTPKQWDASLTKMRKWGSPLEDQDVALLSRYLSAHYHRGAGAYELPTVDAAEAAAQIAPLPDGPYARGAAKQGQLLFQTQCVACHGPDGRGAALGTNVVDRPILYRAPEFADLVRKGRNRMPQFTDSDPEIAALLAYLRTLHP